MTLGTAIYTQAKATAGITALLGTGDNCRIYQGEAPQGVAAPYVVWQRVASIPTPTQREAVRLSFITVQFVCFDTSAAGADALREALIAGFDNQTLPNGEIAVLQDDGRDGYEPALHLWRCDADIVIPHRRTA